MVKQNTSRTRRITQADVARQAGVSTAVVSAILNPNSKGGVRVGKETAERVREVVRQLGYAPNPIAQSLAGGKRNILGVFTYEPVFPSNRGNFFYPMLRGIEMQVSGMGYDLLLFTSAQDTGTSRQIFGGGSNRLGVADGAVLLGQEPDSSELERLATENYPFVIVGRRHSDLVELNWVAAGYADATSEIVHQGHQFGHRQIAFLGSGTTREQQLDREEGYLSAIRKLGLENRPRWRRHSEPDAIEPEWVTGILAEGVTLLLAETPEHAQRVEHILGESDLTVPNDLSVAVLGSPLEDSPAMERWTRFQIPREDMGREAVRLLVGQLDGQVAGPAQTTLPCTFVPGETLRRINGDP